MRKQLPIYSLATVLISSTAWLQAADSTPAPMTIEQKPIVNDPEFPPEMLQTAADVSKKWLAGVDANRYGESWTQFATLSKLTVKGDEWKEILEKTRRPLGSVISREMVDIRTAKDPNAMPKGKYIVVFYKTKFSHKTGYELVTLYLEDGQWHVLTYQVNTQ